MRKHTKWKHTFQRLPSMFEKAVARLSDEFAWCRFCRLPFDLDKPLFCSQPAILVRCPFHSKMEQIRDLNQLKKHSGKNVGANKASLNAPRIMAPYRGLIRSKKVGQRGCRLHGGFRPAQMPRSDAAGIPSGVISHACRVCLNWVLCRTLLFPAGHSLGTTKQPTWLRTTIVYTVRVHTVTCRVGLYYAKEPLNGRLKEQHQKPKAKGMREGMSVLWLAKTELFFLLLSLYYCQLL